VDVRFIPAGLCCLGTKLSATMAKFDMSGGAGAPRNHQLIACCCLAERCISTVGSARAELSVGSESTALQAGLIFCSWLSACSLMCSKCTQRVLNVFRPPAFGSAEIYLSVAVVTLTWFACMEVSPFTLVCESCTFMEFAMVRDLV